MRLIFLLTSWLLAHSCFSQVHIYPEGLTDSTQSYLYIGVDNPIRVKGIAEPYSISISGGTGTLTKVDKDKFVARVSSITDNAIIVVSKQGPGKVLAKREFKVRVIPEPRSNWISGSTISRDSLLKNPFLGIIVPGCYFKLNFEIVSYDATIDHGNFPIGYPIKGSNFSAAFIEHLNTKKTSGSILTFDNIRVKGPDGRSVRSPSIVLYLE